MAPPCVDMLLHVQLCVCRALTQCRLLKTTALAAVINGRRTRPARVIVTMRLGGGRRSMPDGLSRYLIIVLKMPGPWSSGI